MSEGVRERGTVRFLLLLLILLLILLLGVNILENVQLAFLARCALAVEPFSDALPRLTLPDQVRKACSLLASLPLSPIPILSCPVLSYAILSYSTDTI